MGKARAQVVEQDCGLQDALQERRVDERAQSAEGEERGKHEERLRQLRADDEDRGEPRLLIRHRRRLKERRDDPEENHNARERPVLDERRVAEDVAEQSGEQHERETAQAPDRGAEEQDVEDDLRAAAFVLARQKVVRAHAEAERQNRYRRPDDEEDLLEESVLGLRQASDEKRREDEREGEAERLGEHQPERALRQRTLFFNRLCHLVSKIKNA